MFLVCKAFEVILLPLTDSTFSLHKTHYLLNFANALVSGVLTLLVVVSVVLSFMIRDNIEHDINKVNVDEELGKAVKDVDLMNIWDSLQERSGATLKRKIFKFKICFFVEICANLIVFKMIGAEPRSRPS